MRTWGEFKAAVEKRGVTDETAIYRIDVSIPSKNNINNEKLPANECYLHTQFFADGFNRDDIVCHIYYRD